MQWVKANRCVNSRNCKFQQCFYNLKCSYNIVDEILMVKFVVKLAGYINCILELKVLMQTGYSDKVSFDWNTDWRITTEKCRSTKFIYGVN